ncbi:hypothetical protein C0995_010262 [Termitomyces sp. Mi166|nr:hypothetical protein C0995_010262 [Termitomyces sp. Mi166\
MASQSILRAGVRSPVHALMKPALTRPILKKPATLPLSPKPLPFAASFSVVINSPRPSHVHFPSSPAMAATFAAYSPNTYDRGPIITSPESPGLSGWANRQLSPSADNVFKLLAPPKRKAQAHSSQFLVVPTFEDPRSPKPYQEVYKAPAATQTAQFLSVPAIEDPRSPKPYKPCTGVSLPELTLNVPRPRPSRRSTGELGKALSTYPRSPYPSAPIEENVAMDIDKDGSETPERGRWPTKTGKFQPRSRARSLDKEPKSRRRPNLVQAQHVASPLPESFLSPVMESTSAKAKPTPASLDLETQFWDSLTLEEAEPESAYATANEILESAVSVSSPVANIMFGSKDGQLWSPRMSKKDIHRDRVLGVDIGSALSPAQRKVFSKSMVASPSPNDPFAAFPSFTIAMMSGMDGNITYPPRARVVQG